MKLVRRLVRVISQRKPLSITLEAGIINNPWKWLGQSYDDVGPNIPSLWVDLPTVMLNDCSGGRLI